MKNALKQHLEDMYNEKVVDEIVDETSTGLSLKDELNLIARRDWNTKANTIGRLIEPENKICKNCEIAKHNRQMDFPSWKGLINPADPELYKPIMIIGQDLSPDASLRINIAYNLNEDVYNIDNISSRFWARLGVMFNNSFHSMVNNVYITDVARCNVSKHFKGSDYIDVLCYCASNYLLDDIKLVRPKLIIVHGTAAWIVFKRIIEANGNIILSIDTSEDNFKHGRIQIDNLEIPFMATKHLGTNQMGAHSLKMSDLLMYSRYI